MDIYEAVELITGIRIDPEIDMFFRQLTGQMPIQMQKMAQGESISSGVFNQPLIDGLDITQKVNVVDLTNTEIKSAKDLKKYISDLISKQTKETTSDGRIVNFVKKVFRTDGKGSIRIKDHLVYVRPNNMEVKDVHDKAINDILSLIQNSVLIEVFDNSKEEKVDYDKTYRFYVPVRVGDSIYTVRLTNLHNASKDKFESDIYEAIIESNRQDLVPTKTGESSPAYTISIENLLQNVKDHKGNPYILPTEIEIDGKKRSTRNSEGNQIANTVEGIRAFWKYFGNSVVVDEQGRPLVVYHGSTKEFEVFDLNKTNPESDLGKG